MSNPPRLLLDDRGVCRPLFDLWLPHIEPDAVWMIGGVLPDGDLSRDVVPFVELSPLDAVAVAAEVGGDDLQVLAVFCSVSALRQAAVMGLAPGRVTITSVGEEGAGRRIGSSVHLSESEFKELVEVEQRGFTFDIQRLPNVTHRTWRPGQGVEG